jgi:hypothetical protein
MDNDDDCPVCGLPWAGEECECGWSPYDEVDDGEDEDIEDGDE